MYEGDTMTQIFKRTKKCCAKLIRKLTFSTTSPVNLPIKLRSTTTAQYIQQKANTCSDDNPPKMCGMSCSPPESPGVLETSRHCVETGWDLARANENFPIKGAFNNANSNNNGNNTSSHADGCPDEMLSCSAGGDDDDYQMFHISPRFFLKRDMTSSYMRVGDDGGGAEMSAGGGAGGGAAKRNCNFTPRLGMSNLMASMILSRRDLGKWNKSQHNNSCCSEDEIVTNMKDDASDVIAAGIESKVESRGCADTRSNNVNSAKDFRAEQGHIGSETSSGMTTWISNKHPGARPSTTTTTTSFIVPATLTDDKCSKTTNSSRNCYRNSSSNPIQIADQASKSSAKDEPSSCAHIVFEKVKYDRTKRYLRHTPSESSITSSPRSVKSNGRLLSRDPSPTSSFSLDDDNSYSDNNLYSSSSPSHSFCSNGNDCSFDANGNCCHLSLNDIDSTTNPSEKAINRINSLRCRKYSETWDSNGNSADSRRILCEEAWNVFENKINTARDKKMMILYTEDAEDYIRSSSPRSSSTTLETWIDDEIFDNSFNEELERHQRHCSSSLER